MITSPFFGGKIRKPCRIAHDFQKEHLPNNHNEIKDRKTKTTVPFIALSYQKNGTKLTKEGSRLQMVKKWGATALCLLSTLFFWGAEAPPSGKSWLLIWQWQWPMAIVTEERKTISQAVVILRCNAAILYCNTVRRTKPRNKINMQ